MNLNSLDLNLLVALDALLREASVSRAAMRIGLSQPALSHALQRLRDLIGDPLLVRNGARMELTPRAQALRWRKRSIRYAPFSSRMNSTPAEASGNFA
jgi:DNA-binding transcriptional LysR family regulator